MSSRVSQVLLSAIAAASAVLTSTPVLSAPFMNEYIMIQSECYQVVNIGRKGELMLVNTSDWTYPEEANDYDLNIKCKYSEHYEPKYQLPGIEPEDHSPEAPQPSPTSAPTRGGKNAEAY